MSDRKDCYYYIVHDGAREESKSLQIVVVLQIYMYNKKRPARFLMSNISYFIYSFFLPLFFLFVCLIVCFCFLHCNKNLILISFYVVLSKLVARTAPDVTATIDNVCDIFRDQTCTEQFFLWHSANTQNIN